MRINADFTERAAVHAAAMDWTPSPLAGVERKMLDRIGSEVARATSIVRYAPGSRFSARRHGGGEEFLVLEGIFQDEHGDYPAGTYVRNPPGSCHTPRSDRGCTIFVKLWQFAPEDRETVAISPFEMVFNEQPSRPGVRAVDLSVRSSEHVRLEIWQPGQAICHSPGGGIEVLCLSGEFREGGERFARESWLRLPPGTPLDATAGAGGCIVWVKEGHLQVFDQGRAGHGFTFD